VFGFAAGDNFRCEKTGQCEIHKLRQYSDSASSENKGNLQEGEFEGVRIQTHGVRPGRPRKRRQIHH
jgi:hypothetical protein